MTQERARSAGDSAFILDHFGEGVVNSFDRMGSFGLTTCTRGSGRSGGSRSIATFYVACARPLYYGGCATPPCLLAPPAPSGGFPVTPPYSLTTGGAAITWGLDNRMKTPYSHVVDFSITRELREGFVLETSYVGRFGRRLLQQEDMAEPVNMRDPKSGTDYFAAATMFAKATQAGVPVQSIAPIPFWQDFFPTAAGAGPLANLQNAGQACAPGTAPASPSATQNMYQVFSCNQGVDAVVALIQADWFCNPGCATVKGVTKPFQFFDPQWSSLYAWRTIGNSSYNALQVSLRRKMASGLPFRL